MLWRPAGVSESHWFRPNSKGHPFTRFTSRRKAGPGRQKGSCVFTIVTVLSVPAWLACPARKAVKVGPLKGGAGASTQGRAAPPPSRAVRSGNEEPE